LQVVKHVSAQIAVVLTALLAVAPFATAKTTTTTTTTHKHHGAATKKAASSDSHIHHSNSKAHVVHTSTKSPHSSHHGKTKHAKKSWKSQGQHGISSDRTRQIQQALIEKHYLDGDATGVWDTRTQEACRKFQADNGWQSKVLPDSRALIKLGLGPDHKDVINPETAATSPFQPGGGVKSVPDAVAPATASVPER